MAAVRRRHIIYILLLLNLYAIIYIEIQRVKLTKIGNQMEQEIYRLQNENINLEYQIANVSSLEYARKVAKQYGFITPAPYQIQKISP